MLKSIIFFIFLIAVSCQVYDDSQRPEVCERNQQTCETLCSNRKSSTSKNTCDPKTFSYVCTCKDNFTPDPKNVTFPAALAVCQIDGYNCQQNCNGDPTCAQACVQKYICNGAGDANDTATANPTGSTTTTSTKVPSIFTSNAMNSAGLSILLLPLTIFFYYL